MRSLDPGGRVRANAVGQPARKRGGERALAGAPGGVVSRVSTRFSGFRPPPSNRTDPTAFALTGGLLRNLCAGSIGMVVSRSERGKEKLYGTSR